MRILEVYFIIYATSSISRLSGRTYIPTPSSLLAKKAVINVKNNDNLCFIYAVLAKLKENVITQNRERVSKYLPFMSELKYDVKDMPMCSAHYLAG